MARTALTAVASSEDGINLETVDTAAELTDGNSFAWTADRRVWIRNGDDASLTVAFPTPGTVGRGSRAIADGGGSIPAGEHRLFGPFGPEFRQADGSVWINYTGTTPTSVTVAVLD
ncbi:hypothetical protein [Planomonospora venezuelensis]|uniref:Uncharacterized protein n=1 Tax=Planomonospora venezuelensis TaxID=1999 RepID=A0A841D9R3_PLAVE|nr:hypothetical protein [Planomonospora venezuelensis]MBB5965058.1 hypothetical protein [Planomonospora venezuelensis]GIN05025.1 hypothetical protein Pve01_66830 [Planomonospora venezuelensis]